MCWVQPHRSAVGGTHCDVVKQPEGGAVVTRAAGNVVRVLLDGAALPLAGAIRAHGDHLTLPVPQVHRPFDAVPVGGAEGLTADPPTWLLVEPEQPAAVLHRSRGSWERREDTDSGTNTKTPSFLME